MQADTPAANYASVGRTLPRFGQGDGFLPLVGFNF